MTKLYEKNKLTFALIWIGCYVVLASLADSLSQTLGTEKLVTVPVLAAMTAVPHFWMRKQKKRLPCAKWPVAKWSASWPKTRS